MYRKFLPIFLSVIAFWSFSCKDGQKKVIKTEPVVFQKEGVLSITKQETDSVIALLDIEFAQSEYETQTGLMYREGMGNNQGMLFIFPNERIHSFYMKNTEFSLDIIYIKADSSIASFQKNAEPFSESGLTSNVAVKYVLEVNAGQSEKWGLATGDKIDFKKE